MRVPIHGWRRHGGAGALAAAAALVALPSSAQLPGGSLDPTQVPRYVAPLLVPPPMPPAGKIPRRGGASIAYYEIAVRQFEQQVLPPGMPATTVWGYGAVNAPGTVAQGGSFNFPSFTIEAEHGVPVRVKWVNDLVDAQGNYLPHLLPVDQTLHWANPGRDCISGADRTDCRGASPEPYAGPVPIVTHVHGAATYEWADGYPEAWYLPAAKNIPAGFSRSGSFFQTFRGASPLGSAWADGAAVFEYPNEMRAATLWYHDHTLGMTRLNVYAGPAGFYLLRGGADDVVRTRQGGVARLPGPAPGTQAAPGRTPHEIPIVIQDRSFNADGSLYYPDTRAFFEDFREEEQVDVTYIPGIALSGLPSDVSPIWNPEFFGNTMVVNGRTWPVLEVEQRRYRLRLLNGCQSRFLILELSDGAPFWQIGAEGGFLPQPVELRRLLLGPAERADVIVDFGAAPAGAEIVLRNLGPDEPFGGGEPGVDFDPADPGTTGEVMLFRVVPLRGRDTTTPPADLVLPPLVPIPTPAADKIQRVSLNEEMSAAVFFVEDEGNLVEVPPDAPGAEAFGPAAALLGTLSPDGSGDPRMWAEAITENPGVGEVWTWEIHNFTADAHPIHIHLVQFQVVGREGAGGPRPPEPWERGFKDTVIAYPDEITRVKARFDLPGLFVWHCHILEHEDNEMMRPYCVGDSAACAQHDATAPGP